MSPFAGPRRFRRRMRGGHAGRRMDRARHVRRNMSATCCSTGHIRRDMRAASRAPRHIGWDVRPARATGDIGGHMDATRSAASAGNPGGNMHPASRRPSRSRHMRGRSRLRGCRCGGGFLIVRLGGQADQTGSEGDGRGEA